MVTTKLRELRTAKGLTIKALAEELGIKESTLSKYERSEREPNIETLIFLANYFDVSVDYLIGKTDCMHEEHQLISDLLGIDERTIVILKGLSRSQTGYGELDFLEAIIQHPQFPNLIAQINSYYVHTKIGWQDVCVPDANGHITTTISAEVMKTSSMQLIQTTFKEIVEGIPYSKHFLDKK